MRKVIILTVLAGLSMLNAQTGHYSVIEGSATGKALDIVGPPSGNGDIVLVPNNVSGLASVLVQNGRTDQPSLIISQSNAGDITSAASFEILNHAFNVVFSVAGSGAPAGFPGPNGVGVWGHIVPGNDNLYDLGVDTGTSSGNLGFRNIKSHNFSWMAGDGTDTLVEAPATGVNMTLITPNAAPTSVGQALGVSAIAGSTYTLSWGAGGICGSNTDVIFNKAGGCGTDADFTWDYTNGLVTVIPGNAASPGIKISQANTNATGELLQVLDHSGTTVFELNGSGASLLPNYLVTNGMVPFVDSTVNLGAGNAGWLNSYVYNSYTEVPLICPSIGGFATNGCWSWNTTSTSAAQLVLFMPNSFAGPGNVFAFFTPNATSSLVDATFEASLLPGFAATFNIGSSGQPWGAVHATELFNAGSTISINGVAYTWPSSSSNGCLDNTGGTISFVACSGGVTSITGTANEVIASASTGAVTLSTPQAIATTSTVTFAQVNATGSVVTPTLECSGSLCVSGPNFSISSAGAYNGTSMLLGGIGGGSLTLGGILGAGSLAINGTGSTFSLAGTSATSMQLTGGATFGGGVAGIGAAGVAVAGGSVCYIANGLTGQNVTTTIRNSAGTGTCTEVFTCGIKTGGTC